MNIFLSNAVIMIMSVIAVVFTVSARFLKHRYVSEGFSVSGFLLVIASITYALLLGAALTDVLIYILVFSLISAISFLPNVKKSSDNRNDAENHSVKDLLNKDNEEKIDNEDKVDKK